MRCSELKLMLFRAMSTCNEHPRELDGVDTWLRCQVDGIWIGIERADESAEAYDEHREMQRRRLHSLLFTPASLRFL
jgi:hypothetical protein